MKKEIRLVNEEKKILQVTTIDERWYVKEVENKTTGLPGFMYVPSVTWIAEHYPKGIGFYKWLADKGWDEAEAIKSAAGDKGSRVHQAIADLIDGIELKLDVKYPDPKTGEERELSLEEYEAIASFVDWYRLNKPEIMFKEFVLFNDEYGYAGTADLVCKIKDKIHLIDLKTSQYIWPSHKLQVSAYKKAIGYKIDKLSILQLGYKKNKAKYKFTEVEDCFDLFLAAKKIWENEQKGVSPKQKDYPLTLKLEEVK